MRARPRPVLVVAFALALGSAVALGLVRFAYSLLLPAMRADLGWSYLTSGAMNTFNAVGYLAGALLAPACIRRGGGRAMLVGGTAATGLALAAHGAVVADAALYAMRFVAGAFSAVGFVAGGVLAARLAGRADARPGSAGLVLGIYYGGTGLGVVASALLAPWLAGRAIVHAWQDAWLGVGALGVAAALTIARFTGAGVRDDAAMAEEPAIGARPAVAAAVTAEQPESGAEPKVGADALESGVEPKVGAHAAVNPAPSDRAAPAGRFAWRRFRPALAGYFCFGIGYIGYVTFVVTLLREQGRSDAGVALFFVVLGLAVVASPWLWAGLLQRRRGGEPMTVLNALLAAATLLPVLSATTPAVFASGALFGAVLLSLVASTTALIRHNLPAADWPANIGGFTIVFAVGQIVGPSAVGWVADHVGLRTGLAGSAAVLLLGAVCASRQKPLA